jgi:molecular chaperone GrpE|tara:strand:+ start:909 stop:1466 length:558 start_codon:yes stop_codon:yes gene_type:complete
MNSKDKDVEESPEIEAEEPQVLTSEQVIEQLNIEIEDNKDKFMRLAADFDNFRKRIDKSRAQQSLRTKGEVVSNFLEVIDIVEQAKKAEYPDLESSLAGISGIHKFVSGFMNSLNIERFDPSGDQFDFRFHEALTTVEKEGIEPNTIVDVIQSGYKLEGELLRAAKVVVSKSLEEKTKKEEIKGE